MIGAIAGLSALGGSLALAKAAMLRKADAYARSIRGVDRATGAQRSGQAWSVAGADDAQASAVAGLPGDPEANEAVDTVEISPQAVAKAKADADNRFSIAMEKLPDEEQEQLQKLRKRDQEVRTHEAAHKAAGGQYAGSASFSYQTGPDGQQYAVGGEVPIDLSSIPGDPQATIAKMRQIRAAALAPAEPSGADRQVAAKAAEIERKARAELAAGKDEGVGGGEQGEEGETEPTAEAVAKSSPEADSTLRIDVYA